MSLLSKTSRVQTFGSTTKRFDSLSGVSERAPETVESQLEREMRADSSNNQPDSAKKREQPPKFSSSFASNASRFQEPMFGPGPSPGDYEVVVSVLLTQTIDLDPNDFHHLLTDLSVVGCSGSARSVQVGD
jgi:hypothetical protein